MPAPVTYASTTLVSAAFPDLLPDAGEPKGFEWGFVNDGRHGVRGDVL
jgi:hypothetical protein